MPTATHKIMLGDILPPLNSVIIDGDGPVDLDSYTVKFRLLDSDNAVVLNDVTTGVTAHPTQTFTVDTSRDVLKCDKHGFRDSDQVKLSSTTTLPGGLTTDWLFVVNATPNEFQVSLTPDGLPIDITSVGSGTHSVKQRGAVQMDFGATEVDTAGRFKGYWRLYSGSEISTFPKGEGEFIPVVVSELG
jgi:hypothetical protein